MTLIQTQYNTQHTTNIHTTWHWSKQHITHNTHQQYTQHDTESNTNNTQYATHNTHNMTLIPKHNTRTQHTYTYKHTQATIGGCNGNDNITMGWAGLDWGRPNAHRHQHHRGCQHYACRVCMCVCMCACVCMCICVCVCVRGVWLCIMKSAADVSATTQQDHRSHFDAEWHSHVSPAEGLGFTSGFNIMFVVFVFLLRSLTHIHAWYGCAHNNTHWSTQLYGHTWVCCMLHTSYNTTVIIILFGCGYFQQWWVVCNKHRWTLVQITICVRHNA